MNLQDTFDIIKEKITSLTESASDFFEENKKIGIMVVSLILVILICIILLIFSLGSEKAKKNNSIIKDPLYISETPVIPQGPEVPKDYTISRKAKNEWSEEESQQWFSTPSKAEIDSLSKINDSMVNEIIRAAP